MAVVTRRRAGVTEMQLGVVCDYLEEGWPSMDLVAEMLVLHGRALAEIGVLRPTMPRWPGAFAAPSAVDRRFAVERALGRYLAYPTHLWPQRGRYQAFHVADHSYAHLVLVLPQQRTGVFCHDLDAFRAGFPDAPSGSWRRALAALLLSGLRRARLVFYSTVAVKEEILARGLVPEERLIHAPYGVSQEFSPTANGHDAAWSEQGRYLLHVGNLVQRKNPDFLLELFGRLSAEYGDLKLVQIGGQWSAEQTRALAELGLSERVIQKRGLSREELAAVYRCAKLTLLPSTAEGFGLPVIEALACGTPVVASDLAVLREVGGDVVDFCAQGSLSEWCAAIARHLDGRDNGQTRERLDWASRFSWQRHAATIIEAYRAVA